MNLMQNANSLEEFWLPFTGNRAFKKDPRMLTRAEGMYFWDHHGERLIDACSGLFCVALGHGRPEITAAVAAQLGELDYSPPFQYGNPKAFELTRAIAEITPADLNHVFFVNSGSEAVETALKIALVYQ